MATETVGHYQMHLTALQVPGKESWAPYLVIDRFDEAAGAFLPALDKHRVDPGAEFPSYEDAIEAARRAGNAWVAARGN